MGFNLPWFGKKQDNVPAVPPVSAAPSDTPSVVDASVPPVVVPILPDVPSDTATSAVSDAPVALPVEQPDPEVTEPTEPAFSPEVSTPTSPAADLMGQTNSVPSEVPPAALEESQPVVEPTPTFDAAPTLEAPAPEVPAPEADTPSTDTQGQPETPKNQF